MTTYVGSGEAASILGVAPATLYAYVSRGRIGRRTAADGRASLFDRDEVEALAQRSRRAPSGPPPTIDVRVASTITRLDEAGVSIRGHDLAELARTVAFEDVAELLWTGTLPTGTRWPAAAQADRQRLAPVLALTGPDQIGRLAIAALQLDAVHRDDDAPTAARRLLASTPSILGSRRRTGSFAQRLTGAWVRSPSRQLVEAIDTALKLLADHELATSTLAVRVAASVRASPYGAFASGLTTVQGALHGSASEHSHRFLAGCAATSPAEMIAARRKRGERIPGFGHKVYQGQDPRYAVLLDAARRLAEGSARRRAKIDTVDALVAEAGRTIPKYPNIDLALGALTWIADLDPNVPVFAVARIAGWAAHYDEELDAPPVRFRGVSAPR